VPAFSYSLTTYDPDRPWIVLSREHRVIELPEGADFVVWARETYPGDATMVELDPQTQQPWPSA
jgi:hypothetical protein